ncbi:MAG: Asp-tRNA(Asn)/Glu-tRNA(Gln) amidotransferase subunit GatC [Bdellovibrionales bacterium]|nr:Asp-tRNA(Asn)/Glu-tRNA(Gln) amidotransferase subunit GatC [Bdellovibrionales bacterium]
MTPLTKSDIKKIARLAQLEIDDSELDQKLSEFNRILSFTEKLASANVDQIKPTQFVSEETKTPLSEDKVKPSLDQELVFQNAPDRQDFFFKVPRMIGEEK